MKPHIKSLLDERAELKASLKPVKSQTFRGEGEPYSEIDAINIPTVERIEHIEAALDLLEVEYD